MAGLVFFTVLLFTCCSLNAQSIPSKYNHGNLTGSKPDKQKFSAYLFVYFTGNHKNQEAIHYALSNDGYHFWTLNKDKPVISSAAISSSGGVRDPHLLRGKDDKTFYVVATDMVSANGCNCKRYPNQDSLLRVWVPQTIYDDSAKKYMIYFSMKRGNEPDKIYYANANKNFTGLEGEPVHLFYSPDHTACIDGDIEKKVVNTICFLIRGKGSDMHSFNPNFTQLPGVIIRPGGAADFSKGAVIYHIKVPGHDVKKYDMTAEVNNNPLFDGYYADPEILFSHKTGKYYLFPTSDGFANWSGTYFKTLSSPDLVNWKDEGIILDLTKNVSWANRNAWAPTINEKNMGGKYKYFYYFCAAQKNGVTVSNSPAGPFVDSGEPLIDKHPHGINGGQEIDTDVFVDPKSGKTFLYWGNGCMAVAVLNSNMVSIDTSSIKIITPDRTFREGTEVAYHNGKYYFMWSQNDTRKPDYKLYYGYSNSPTGKIIVPKNNIVIEKDTMKAIYATGHNCVLKRPGTDEWYIQDQKSI